MCLGVYGFYTRFAEDAMRFASLSVLFAGLILTGSISGVISQMVASAPDPIGDNPSWLTRIITVAEHDRQGRVIAVAPQRYRPDKYDVRFVGSKYQGIIVLEINTKTKQIVSIRKPTLLERLFGYSDADAISAIAAKLSITEAIQVAEAQTHGTAIRAFFRRHKGHAQYDVYVAHNGKFECVKIDGMTGKDVSSI